ncbi:MAG: hypothetical protein GF308_19175 [Candidatus Heimdallarchaeota archaeon]|nr:hypothetical protein [Candidatus Heimdallarchaeota archaeon]
MKVIRAVTDPNEFSDELLNSLTAEDRELLRIVYPPPAAGEKAEVFPLFSRQAIAKRLTELYECYQAIAPRTLAKNLIGAIGYGAGGRTNSRKDYPNLFRKNLLRVYPWVSDTRAPEKDAVGFPREGGYNLLDPRTYKANHAPHEDLQRKCLAKLLEGVSEGVVRTARRMSLRHHDDEGAWTVDDRLIVERRTGKETIWNVETYTGTEGYGEFFIKRLLTAKSYPKERFVFFFRVTADEAEGRRAVRRNNEQNPKGTERHLPMENTYFYCYKRIGDLRRRMGIGKKTVTRG